MTGASFIAVTSGAVGASAALNASMAAQNINTAALNASGKGLVVGTAEGLLLALVAAMLLLTIPLLVFTIAKFAGALLRALFRWLLP